MRSNVRADLQVGPPPTTNHQPATHEPGRRPAHSQRPMVFPVSVHFAPMKLPAALPSFIGLRRPVTASPALNVVARQPFRDSELGLPPSRLHSVFWPLVSTTTWIQICGLVHCTS